MPFDLVIVDSTRWYSGIFALRKKNQSFRNDRAVLFKFQTVGVHGHYRQGIL
ncbi:hypothetical protein F444_03010, partial [Phytophthora nicotianae P1976]